MSPDAFSLAGLKLRDRRGGSVDVTGRVLGSQRIAVPVSELDLRFSDALVLVDGRERVVARFDDPGFRGVGRASDRVDLTEPDWSAHWLSSAGLGGSPGL